MVIWKHSRQRKSKCQDPEADKCWSAGVFTVQEVHSEEAELARTKWARGRDI